MEAEQEAYKKIMILYNVTISVDSSIEREWLEWMKDVHIPEVMETGLFVENKILKLKEPAAEEGSSTFAIQYFLKNEEDYKNYNDNFAGELRQKHKDKFGEKFMAFRTVLEEV